MPHNTKYWSLVTEGHLSWNKKLVLSHFSVQTKFLKRFLICHNNIFVKRINEYQKKPEPSLNVTLKPFHKQQILDSSKLKEFADDNFEFDEICSKFFK